MIHKDALSAVTALIAVAISTTAHGSPYCAADLNNSGDLDFLDISEFLEGYTSGNLIVDFNDSGDLDFLDISAFLSMYTGACPDLTDTDGDRIPDYAETDNGIFIDFNSTGTNPKNPDTDGDGLDDGDEVIGTVDDLMLPGANPLRKDIFVECDWFAGIFQGRMEDYRPTDAVNNRVVQAFNNASTPNPYGLPDGITIHLDYGQNAENAGGNQLPGSPDVIQFDSDLNMYKAAHFDPRRKGYYHYAIFANRYSGANNNSSGFAEINGDDFIVTMVNYNSTNNMANTIAHELGHNLGLLHGGDENRNGKINYNSVMNYRHQFPGVDTNSDTYGDGPLDYSHGFNNDVWEISIDETVGVNASPVDFNNNGVIDIEPYALNLNCSTGWTAPCGTDGGVCYDSSCTILSDHDDWDNINWNRLTQSSDRHPTAEDAPDRQLIECKNWPGKLHK